MFKFFKIMWGVCVLLLSRDIVFKIMERGTGKYEKYFRRFK